VASLRLDGGLARRPPRSEAVSTLQGAPRIGTQRQPLLANDPGCRRALAAAARRAVAQPAAGRHPVPHSPRLGRFSKAIGPLCPTPSCISSSRRPVARPQQRKGFCLVLRASSGAYITLVARTEQSRPANSRQCATVSRAGDDSAVCSDDR